MDTSGWIKTYRKIKKWRWYKHPFTRLLWEHILVSVNYEKSADGRVEILPGQMLTTQQKLADDNGITYKQVRTALDNLESTGEITIDRAGNKILITVGKWADYQGGGGEAGRPWADLGQTLGRPWADLGQTSRVSTSILRNKESKKERNKEEREGPAPAVPLRGIMKNVKMSDEEYDQLCQSYERPKALIDKISTIIANSGKKYRSHYALAVKIAEEDGFARRTVIHRAEPEPEKQEDYIPMPDDTRAIFDKWKEGTKVK